MKFKISGLTRESLRSVVIRVGGEGGVGGVLKGTCVGSGVGTWTLDTVTSVVGFALAEGCIEIVGLGVGAILSVSIKVAVGLLLPSLSISLPNTVGLNVIILSPLPLTVGDALGLAVPLVVPLPVPFTLPVIVGDTLGLAVLLPV